MAYVLAADDESIPLEEDPGRSHDGTPASDEPMLYCPVCSCRLSARQCKLICEQCGYYMSCADYY